MTNLIRSAIVALALVGATSAAYAAPATVINNNGTLDWQSDARSFFEQLERNGS